MDTEERLRRLERLVAQMGEIVFDQGWEIERLRMELSEEITNNAIASLTPWPVGVRRTG